MRKPLIALGLALSTSVGAIPAAGALAAAPVGPHPNTATSATKTSQAVSGSAIVQTALKYLGFPYTATGNSPSTGFSCIGFVSFVYRSNGIPLPGDLQDALNYAPQVPFSSLLPGDILYFQNTIWNGLSHAGIYIGAGKFVHAEWYGKGVRISSFNNDRSDGNYWIKYYMTANRPWTGAAVGTVIGSPNPTAPSTTAPAGDPSTTATTGIATGPTAVVTSYGLRVRSTPSTNASVVQVVTQGTTLTIIGKQRAWYKVQLPSGAVGWVLARYVSVTGATTPASSVPGGTTGATSNPTGPLHTNAPITSAKYTVSARVTGLRVHASPSTGSPIVTTAYQGQRLQVIGRSGNWLEVLLPNGTTGWVNASYTSAKATVHHSAARSGNFAGATATTATAAMRLHSGPSLSASVVTVIQPGMTYRVIGWSNSWAHVQLASGLVGWVSGSVLGQPASTPTYRSVSYTHPKHRAARISGGSVVTTAVRMHTRPGIKAPLVGVVVGGTHVRVLGHSGGWALVQTPSGLTGYVLGSYVR